jgi:type I restriction enzyme S subunit
VRQYLQTGPFGTMLSASEYSVNGVPVIAVQDIGDNKLVYHKFVFVSQEIAERLNRYRVKENDIIFGRKGATDRRAIIKKNEEGWLQGSDCIRLRFDESINSKFISYQLGSKYFKKWMSQFSVGATMPSLNQEILKLLPLRLPSLEYQNEITEALSSLDDKIALLLRQIKTLEQLAETLYKQWFLEKVNEDWLGKTIEEVCTKIASGGTPSTKISEYYNGDINWYSTKELNDCFLYESVSKITQPGLESSSAKLFPENTIVLAIYAAPTVGRLGILANQASFNQAACGFIVDEKQICFEYLYLHLFNSRRKLNDMASGSAQQNLNVGIMKAFEILIPPKDLMQKFREQVRPIFEKINSNSKQIRTLTQLRDTLLPKLMSGEVRIEN